MVHWWMLVPSGKERIIMSATSKEISKSISTPWYITYHGLGNSIDCDEEHLSIYPDFQHPGGAKSFFRLFDMHGGSISSKIKFFLLPNK
jgi:hypothetical protein